MAAEGVEEYVAAAVELAGNLPAMADLRVGLRGRLAESPLGDAPAFVADLEAAYRGVWHEYLRADAVPALPRFA